MPNDENQAHNEKLFRKFELEAARLVVLGKFRGMTIFAARPSKCEDEEWGRWVKGIGTKLGEPEPTGGTTHTSAPK